MRAVNVSSRTYRLRWIILTIIAVFTLSIMFWWSRQPESYEAAGSRILDALESGNGRLLASYIDKEEKELSGATPETLDAFLRDFYSPKVKGFLRDGDPVLNRAELATHYTQLYKHRDGRRIGVALALHRRGKRVESCPIIQHLVDAALRVELPPDKPQPTNRDKLVFMIDAYGRNADNLTATGITRVCYGQAFNLESWTWREYVDTVKASLKRFDHRVAQKAHE